VVYESDGRLAALVRDTCRQKQWALREPRRPEACLQLLAQGGPSVLLLKLAPPADPARPGKEAEKAERSTRELERQMTLLEQVQRLVPEAACVVVCDPANPALTGLAWELGASYVLSPPELLEDLPGIVAALMPRLAGRGQESGDRGEESRSQGSGLRSQRTAAERGTSAPRGSLGSGGTRAE
jgi:hypothetical protein